MGLVLYGINIEWVGREMLGRKKRDWREERDGRDGSNERLGVRRGWEERIEIGGRREMGVRRGSKDWREGRNGRMVVRRGSWLIIVKTGA